MATTAYAICRECSSTTAVAGSSVESFDTSPEDNDLEHPMPQRLHDVFSFTLCDCGAPQPVMQDRSNLAADHSRVLLGEITNVVSKAQHLERHRQKSKTPTSPCFEQKPHEEYRFDMLTSMLLRERPDVSLTQMPAMQQWRRACLIDWLVEVHDQFDYRRQTLFLTVSLIDRYLSRKRVVATDLQLIAITAMFISAKFEEAAHVKPPELAELVYITDSAYGADQIAEMECLMLATLNFEVACPTAAHFLEHMVEATQSLPLGCDDARTLSSAPLQVESEVIHSPHATPHDAAWCVLEFALIDSLLMGHLPSKLASAALLLSRSTSKQLPVWPAHFERLSGYTEVDLQACVAEMWQFLQVAPIQPHQATMKKYRRVELIRSIYRLQSFP
jgi:hypothetical protein